MNSEARHELSLLEAVEEDREVTQRRLASKLGIAVGLANIYLKRLARKGYIKCVAVRRNRLLYLITPAGIAEKTRLTYEYMEYSLRLYRDARHRVRSVLEPLAATKTTRVAICGTGEAAQLAYICLTELGVVPVAVFDLAHARASNTRLFDLQVRPIADHAAVAFDMMVVATLEEPSSMVARLTLAGVPPDRLLPLREPSGQRPSS